MRQDDEPAVAGAVAAAETGPKGGRTGGARTVALRRNVPVVREPVTLPPVLTVAELASKLETTGIEIIKELMKLGIMANINQQIDYDTAAKVAVRSELGDQRRQVPEAMQRANADFESRRAEADTDPNASDPAACRHDHGPRRPRQDQVARRHPLGKRRGR